jgi:dolichol kinase
MTVSEKLKWFKSITAIDRKSYGSWLFSVVVMLCFYIQNKTTQTEYYYLPLLVLTICDPMAAIIGNKLNFISLNIFGHLKTIGGSLAFFVTALLLLSALNHYFYSFNVYAIFLFASVSTIAELLSTRGWDNLTIPTSISFLIYLV